MNTRLFSAIGEVSEDLIAEADPALNPSAAQQKVSRRLRCTVSRSAAACFLLIVAILLPQFFREQVPPSPSASLPQLEFLPLFFSSADDSDPSKPLQDWGLDFSFTIPSVVKLGESFDLCIEFNDRSYEMPDFSHPQTEEAHHLYVSARYGSQPSSLCSAISFNGTAQYKEIPLDLRTVHTNRDTVNTRGSCTVTVKIDSMEDGTEGTISLHFSKVLTGLYEEGSWSLDHVMENDWIDHVHPGIWGPAKARICFVVKNGFVGFGGGAHDGLSAMERAAERAEMAAMMREKMLEGSSAGLGCIVPGNTESATPLPDPGTNSAPWAPWLLWSGIGVAATTVAGGILLLCIRRLKKN